MEMTNYMKTLAVALMMVATPVMAQQVNDSNTPLHLMRPAYRIGYGVSSVEQVKQTMDRVLKYIDSETPAKLINGKTGEEVTKWKQIDADTKLKPGGFRLTSYEWGVTYSGVLAAYEATGDDAYRDYVYGRMKFLAQIAPYYKKVYEKNKAIDGNVRRVLEPHALDDCGAICSAMIKASLKDKTLGLNDLIANYSDYVLNKEYRLSDGTFARIRPQYNTLCNACSSRRKDCSATDGWNR